MQITRRRLFHGTLLEAAQDHCSGIVPLSRIKVDPPSLCRTIPGDIVYVKSWRLLLEWLDDGGDFCMSDETKDLFCSTASLLTNNNNHVYTPQPSRAWCGIWMPCVCQTISSHWRTEKSFRVMHCFPRMRRRRRTWVDKRHEWQLFVKDANRPCLLPCLVKWWLSHESVNYGLLDGVTLQGIKYADKMGVGGTIKRGND